VSAVLSSPCAAAPEFTSDWFSHHIPVWTQLLAPYAGRPVRALEIGSYEGRSAIWLCEQVLTHPDARLTCVDLFSGDGSRDYSAADGDLLYRRFTANTAPYAARLRVLRGESGRLLRLEPVAPTYHFVYIDGSHKSWHVLEDAILAWRLLEVGGLLLFDDYMGGDPASHHYPHLGINCFLACHRDALEIVHRGYQLGLRKTSDVAG
jgi:predicted O-methyltransferase YrrM